VKTITEAFDKEQSSSEGIPYASEGNPPKSGVSEGENILSQTPLTPRENPEGDPDTRLVLLLRRSLEKRKAMFTYDEALWHEAVWELLDDGYSRPEIEALIGFSQDDEFWRGQVNDFPRLAKFADKMIDRARRWHNASLPGDTSGVYPGRSPSQRSVEDWFAIYRNLLDREEWSDEELRGLAQECYDEAQQ
jgi:hypothetical protein